MSIKIEFPSKAIADRRREQSEKYVCPVDDDKRLKTVAFKSDTPEGVLDRIRSVAVEGEAEQADTTGQASLTDHEKDRIDFGAGQANVPWARSIKAIAEKEGVSDWTAHLDHSLSVDEHRQVMREAGREGGGSHHEPDERDAERQAEAARREQKEGCDHAEGHCEHGDTAACDYLQNVCGYDDGEVDDLLAATDGGAVVDDEGPIGGQAGGALRRSWGGYKGAVTELAEALEGAVAAWEHAQQAARAINSIRDDFNESPLDFEALEAVQADLLDFVRLTARECHECHAVHSDHDHQVTDGDREDVREFVGEGADETPVGVADETADALGSLEPDDRHVDDGDDEGLGQFGINPDDGSDSDSREHRAAQNDGYLRVSDAPGVESQREGLGEFGARTADTMGLEELEDEA